MAHWLLIRLCRPSVTSAEEGRGYSRRAWYLAARNILSLCVLGSNSVVKTTWKSRFLQNPKDRHEPHAGTCRRSTPI